MSDPNSKPDLEDSINVTEAHGKVVREAAACAREKRIVDNGIEPVSLWAFVACGAVLLVAGGILGGGGRLFAYGTTFREGYVRTPAGGAADAGPVPKEALAAYMAKGSKIYSAKCNGCHGSDAKGNGSTFPSLVGSAWANGETERFAMIILNGLEGPVSNGTTYGVMPPQGIGMTPEDLAGIMTYVRNNFGNAKGDVVTDRHGQSRHRNFGGPQECRQVRDRCRTHGRSCQGVAGRCAGSQDTARSDHPGSGKGPLTSRLS